MGQSEIFLEEKQFVKTAFFTQKSRVRSFQ